MIPKTSIMTSTRCKENRYRMESGNRYKGIENVTIPAIEHDLTLTQDIIFVVHQIQ
jgi:hypothetical protein